MKQKISDLFRQFHFRVDIEYLFGEWERSWGNPNGWGLSISFGLGILKPLK